LAFKKLHRDSGQTILYVTHDQAEALSMADRIGILHEGRFVQIGTPDEIYCSPVNEFVARFIGSPPMNIFDVTLEGKGGQLLARGQDFDAHVNDAAAPDKQLPARAAIGVRPEEIYAAPEQRPEARYPGTVIWIERLGSHQILDVRLGGQLIKVRTRAGHAVDREGPAWFGFATSTHRILDRVTGLFAVAGPHSRTDLKSKREETTCV
jgi:multiple sugar transport system ATP-binding protein